MSDSSYNVGYRKPPKHSRFRKGSSGNPRGRPAGRVNVTTVLERILQERIVLRENGKERIVTKLEAVIEQVVNKAAEGDLTAFRHLIALTRPADQTLEVAKTPSDTDLIVMKTVLKRFKGYVEAEDEQDQ
jgi:hypothetical protein